jgi:hypothetical protein
MPHAILNGTQTRSPGLTQLTPEPVSSTIPMFSWLAAHSRAAAEGGELRLIISAVGVAARIIYLTCVDHVIPCFPAWPEP